MHKHHKKPTATTTTTPTPTTTTSATPADTAGSGGGSSIGGCNGCSWNGDFSTGNFLQYDSFLSGNNIDGNPADFTLVQNGPTPPSPFQHAFNATLQSGSGSVKSGQAGERTLTTLWPANNPAQGKSRANSGATTWYRDEIYFPAGFQPSADTDFNWVYELHNAPDGAGEAMVSCGVDTSAGAAGPYSDGGDTGTDPSPERFSCRILGGGSSTYPFDSYSSANWFRNPAVDWAYIIGLHTIRAGEWYDMVWQIGWSCAPAGSPSTGFVNWWINGKRVGSYVEPTLL